MKNVYVEFVVAVEDAPQFLFNGYRLVGEAGYPHCVVLEKHDTEGDIKGEIDAAQRTGEAFGRPASKGFPVLAFADPAPDLDRHDYALAAFVPCAVGGGDWSQCRCDIDRTPIVGWRDAGLESADKEDVRAARDYYHARRCVVARWLDVARLKGAVRFANAFMSGMPEEYWRRRNVAR